MKPSMTFPTHITRPCVIILCVFALSLLLAILEKCSISYYIIHNTQNLIQLKGKIYFKFRNISIFNSMGGRKEEEIIIIFPITYS